MRQLSPDPRSAQRFDWSEASLLTASHEYGRALRMWTRITTHEPASLGARLRISDR